MRTTYATLKRIDISSTDSSVNANKIFIETSINAETVEENIEISDNVRIILIISFIGRQQKGHYGLLGLNRKIRTIKVYETGSDGNLLPYFPHIRQILIKRNLNMK